MAFIIEICTAENGRTLYSPLAEMLRGRFSFRKVLNNTHESLRLVQNVAPELPGIHLSLDLKTRTFTAYDPLGEDPAGQKLWRDAKAVFDKYPQHFENFGPVPKTVREKLSDDDVKLHLHWMRRLIEAGNAVYARSIEGVESDKLPPIDEIAALPGKRKISPMGLTMFKKSEDAWTDVVAGKQQLAAAGSGGNPNQGGGQNQGGQGNRR